MTDNETKSKREILSESPLFDNLLTPERAMLADLFSVLEFEPGQVVFNQGDVGDSLYVIAKGDVDVLQKGTDGQPRVVAVLGAPQFFGEMSLIDKEYRSATIRAKTQAKLLHLTNENLHVFAKNYRNGFTWIAVNIARALSSRLRETNRRLAEAM
ncbi:MAG: cyclic nucleotide-binding domain-containing protein [Myxococcota bacterium]